MNWFLWFGLIVATWRVSRLLVKDEFPPTRALREWVTGRLGATNADGELVGGVREFTTPVAITIATLGLVFSTPIGALLYLALGDYPAALGGAIAVVAAGYGAAIWSDRARAALVGSVAYVFTCMWCMSFWVGLALWWIAVAAGFSVPLPWIMVAAASGLSGWLGSFDARIDQSYEEAERRLGR